MVLWHWVPYWCVPQEGGGSSGKERWTEKVQEEGAQEEGTQEKEVWEEGGGRSGRGRMDTALAGHTHQSLFQCKYSGLWSKKRKKQQEWVELVWSVPSRTQGSLSWAIFFTFLLLLLLWKVLVLWTTDALLPYSRSCILKHRPCVPEFRSRVRCGFLNNSLAPCEETVRTPFLLQSPSSILPNQKHFSLWHGHSLSMLSLVQGPGKKKKKKHNLAWLSEAQPPLLCCSQLPEALNSSVLISTSLLYLLWLAVTMVILVTVIRSPFMESGYFKWLFKDYCCRSVILQLDALVQLY